ncbi:GntR family transcriptional regulator [Leptospira interrogans]
MSNQPIKDSMRIAAVAAPIRTQVVDMLRSAITSGHFEPNRRLVEKDLCEMLGVSRPSVREALRELEAEGLIRTVPNRGPVVAKLEVEDAVGIYQIRGVLEALATKLFCQHATDEQIEKLQARVDNLANTYKSGDLEGIISAKAAFYEVLLEGAKNRLIPNFLRVINARIIQLRRVSLSSKERMTSSIDEIHRIMDAIRRRDQDQAFQATMNHIEMAAQAGITGLSQSADGGTSPD